MNWDSIVMVVGAYLLGAAPVLHFIGRLRGLDSQQEEDMHIALWEKGGRAYATIAVLWDMSKGVIAVVVARALGFDLLVVALAGLAAVGGQMWPPFKGQGEKGNSTGLAMALALTPTWAFVAGLVCCAAGFFIRTIPRFLSRQETMRKKLKFGGPPSLGLPVGMLVCFAVLPIAHWLLYPDEVRVAIVLGCLWGAIALRRLTADLKADLTPGADLKRILLNRFLFDRSFI